MRLENEIGLRIILLVCSQVVGIKSEACARGASRKWGGQLHDVVPRLPSKVIASHAESLRAKEMSEKVKR